MTIGFFLIVAFITGWIVVGCYLSGDAGLQRQWGETDLQWLGIAMIAFFFFVLFVIIVYVFYKCWL